MSKNSNKAWNTKYGKRRVRDEAPTLAEAIAAAQGMSDQIDDQVEIAASLIGLPPDQVRAELLKAGPKRKVFIKTVVYAGASSAPRAVEVERKPARRVISGAARPGRLSLTSPRSF